MSAIKAYSYIRMSTEEQLKGDSLTRQINACRKFADEQKLELDETVRLRDIGVSAFHSKNKTDGNLGTFLKLVEDGDIERGSFLLVDSMDRLSRDDPRTAFALLDKIINSGISVATLDDRQVYSAALVKDQPHMLFVALGAMLRSHQESATKSGRLLSAWSGKRKKARSPKRTVMTQLMPAWLYVDRNSGAIVADDYRQKIIVEIFEKLRDGYGAYSITRAFNRRGEANWSDRSQHWSNSYVMKISKNRAVLGECQPHTVFHDQFGNYTRVAEGEAISGYFPAVITAKLFHAANDAMSARRLNGAGRKGEGIPNLFTGLLKCGFCSAGLQYVDKGPPPKGGKYVRCSRSVQGGKCKAMFLRYELLERGLLQMVGSIDVERILGGASAKTKLMSSRNQLSEQLAKRDLLKLRLARLSNLIQESEDPNVRKALASSVSELFAESEACESLVASLQADIAQMEVIDPQAHQQSIAKLLESIRAGSEADDQTVLSRRRALMAELRWLLTKIVITLSRTPLHEVSATFEFEDDGYDEMQALLEQTIVPDDMEDDTLEELASQGELSEPALKHAPRNDVKRKSSGPAALGIVNRAGLATFLRERPFYATLVYRNGESVYVDELGKELERQQSVRHADFIDVIRLDRPR